MPMQGSTSAVVACVVDDLVTKIGEGPASCSPKVILSTRCPQSIPIVVAHMPCTNSRRS